VFRIVVMTWVSPADGSTGPKTPPAVMIMKLMSSAGDSTHLKSPGQPAARPSPGPLILAAPFVVLGTRFTDWGPGSPRAFRAAAVTQPGPCQGGWADPGRPSGTWASAPSCLLDEGRMANGT
jgi:hypothetical protein